MKSISKISITVVFFLYSILAFSQSGHLYTINEGLSSTEISQILQDYKGFIWIATNNGLNRFDGLQFSVYPLTDKWDRTMHDMDITCLFEDENKVLYVGTTKGLWRYNRKHDIFDKITGCDLNGTFTSYHVKKIIRSHKYGLLVATSGHKILRLNDNRLDYVEEIDDKLSSKYINNIYEDSHYNLYVNAENSGTYIKRFNSDMYEHVALQNQGFVESFLYGNTRKDVIINTNKGIYGIDSSYNLYPLETGQMGKIKGVCSAKNRTWIYTLDGKIAFYDENESLNSYDDPVLNDVLFNNRIELLYEDSFHNLWVVLKNKGIFMKSSSDNSILNFFMPNQKSLCIYNENDEFWIGTESSGIYIYSTREGSGKKCVRHILDKISVYGILKDKKGDVWVASDDGLFLIDDLTYSVKKHFKHDAYNPKSIPTNIIWNLAQDSKGNLWIGTCAKGLCRLEDVNQGSFTVFDDTINGKSRNKLCNNWILDIKVDNDDNIWIGTANGLSKYDSNGKFENFFNSVDNEQGKMIETVEIINDEIWIGTVDGIYILNKHKNVWRKLLIDKMPSTAIKGIQSDNKNNVWITTNNYIYRFNPRSMACEKYPGSFVSNYSRHNNMASKDGSLFFGGANGVLHVSPQIDGKKKIAGNLVFTDIKLFNKSIKPGQVINNHVIIEYDVDEVDYIRIPYEDCFLTLGFNVLNFSELGEFVYSYQMKGYDKQWQIVPDRGENRATYTNLSPGEYDFIVKAENSGTVRTRHIKIIVLPPWWLSLPMKILYFICAFLFIAVIAYFYHKRNVKKLRQQQLEHLAYLNEMKLQFFIDISHEIRTPLTLILTPLEKLYLSSDKSNKAVYETMYHNAKRLLNLVNQLIDIRKIDKGKFVLKIERVEINNYLRNIIENFRYYAEEKNIGIEMKSLFPKLFVFIDPSHFEKVISNLLTNAFKFSPENSKIVIYIDIDRGTPGFLHVEVQDNGIGIPKGMQNSIFERFVQIEGNRTNLGTGIGLHLSRQIVMLHHGRIWVESTEGEGSVFCIKIPLGKKHFCCGNNTADIYNESLIPMNTIHNNDGTVIKDSNSGSSDMPSALSDKKLSILIADDENDIRKYLKNELCAKYNIIECDDGEQALKEAVSKIPDLIICDIMMPGIDGITLCKKIRSNYNISHLPIILLTAKINAESVQEGIAAGADDYISKPFNMNLLEVKIKKLIEMRSNLQYYYSNDPKFEIKEGNNISPDEKLKNKIKEVMNASLSDPQLNVDFLSREVGYSRVHLNRKMKELFNMSAHEYIKVTKMKQASVLLKENKLNISEVAYAVGFTNHAHFSACFKEFYGKTPSEYVNDADK